MSFIGVGAMVRGGCLPVRGSTKMSWKYDHMCCVYGDVESEKHVLLDCNLYVNVRSRWKEKMNAEHVVTCGCSVASNWQSGRPHSDLHSNNLHHPYCC